MINPGLKEFIKLSKQGNLIPIYKEINADLDTPVSAFLKIKKNDYAFLLESVEGREKIARYSFLGSNPSLIFRCKNKSIELIYPHKGKKVRFSVSASPLQELKKIMSVYKSVTLKGLPRFFGGLVGYMSYDAVRFFEKIPDKNPDQLKLPDFLFLLTHSILIFDHVNHTIKIAVNAFLAKQSMSVKSKKKIYNRAVGQIAEIEKELRRPVQMHNSKAKRKRVSSKPVSNYKKSDFCKMVEKAKRYIKKGDIIQVVPSQRFKSKVNGDVFGIYRSLRSLNPSPYMFFLKLKEVTLVGSSPEMLVRCEEGVVRTRPIAGTRPRGMSDREDRKLEQELLRDKKERAEHIMLVDLGRNDLGRVCLPGKVELSEFMKVEKYSHVMHLVSEVKGILDNRRYDIYDVLSACFPAGTVSGSPKIRAMEIIDELENTRRGPYAGCVGYISFSHNIDTCITIRTVIIKGNYAYVQAGGGIVADSRPSKEYQESVNKAKAMIEAVTECPS